MAIYTYDAWPWIYTTNATTTGNAIFPWTTTTTSTTITLDTAYRYVWNQWQEQHKPVLLSAEEHRLLAEAAQRRADERQRRAEERSRVRLAIQPRLEGAQDRALELLDMLLTDEERVYRAANQEILVRGSDGGLYVIEERSVHGNIRQIDEHGCVLGRVCVAPGMYDHETGYSLPLADGWVGQYLAIKYNEERFRGAGNWSHRGECRRHLRTILAAA